MRYIFAAILICSGLNLIAQTISVDNSDFFSQIATIYEFKQSIVSLTFDDGSKNQFKIALPLLREKKIPATFYVITNLVDSTVKSIILKNLSQDYEIGSHTVSHSNLIRIGSENAKMELLNSKKFLQNNFGMNAGLTMSYPWGIYNNSVKLLVKEDYLAARSTGPGYNSLYKLDRYSLQVQAFDDRTRTSTANSWIDNAIHNHSWLVEMIHGINKVGYSPVDSIVLAEHLDYIKNVGNNIWCSNVSNVIRYLDESKNADIKCETCNDTVFKIRINDFMDDSIYNQELTVRIKIPINWDSVRISNSKNFRTEYYNKSKFIIFNALPDNQLITIRPGSISVPLKESGIRLVYLSANPFLDNIKLSLEVLDERNIDIILCDINGKLLFHQEEKNAVGVITLDFNTTGLSSGLYLLRIRSNGSDFIIKKLIKI